MRDGDIRRRTAKAQRNLQIFSPAGITSPGKSWDKLRPQDLLIAVEVERAKSRYKQSADVRNQDLFLPRFAPPLCHYPSGRPNVLNLYGAVAAATQFTYAEFSPTPGRVGRPESDKVHPIAKILNRRGYYCGVFPGVDARDIASWQFRKRELVLSSETQHHQSLRFGDPEYPDSTYDDERFGYYGLCMYNVMLVELKDCFSELLAVGQMHAQAWKACKSRQSYTTHAFNFFHEASPTLRSTAVNPGKRLI